MNNFPIVYVVTPKILKPHSNGFYYNGFFYNIVFPSYFFEYKDAVYYTIMKCYLLDADIDYKADGTMERSFEVVNVYDKQNDEELKSYARTEYGSKFRVKYVFTSLEAARLFRDKKNSEIDLKKILKKIPPEKIDKYRKEDDILEEKSVNCFLELQPGFKRIREKFKNEV